MVFGWSCSGSGTRHANLRRCRARSTPGSCRCRRPSSELPSARAVAVEPQALPSVERGRRRHWCRSAPAGRAVAVGGAGSPAPSYVVHAPDSAAASAWSTSSGIPLAGGGVRAGAGASSDRWGWRSARRSCAPQHGISYGNTFTVCAEFGSRGRAHTPPPAAAAPWVVTPAGQGGEGGARRPLLVTPALRAVAGGAVLAKIACARSRAAPARSRADACSGRAISSMLCLFFVTNYVLLGGLAGDSHRVVERELLLAVESAPERLAFDERHDVVQDAIGLARIVQREDVRVLEVGREPNLPEEPLGADGGGELGPQGLDGDLAAVAQVGREVDRGHAAFADQALDLISVAERGAKLLQYVCQSLPRRGGVRNLQDKRGEGFARPSRRPATRAWPRRSASGPRAPSPAPARSPRPAPWGCRAGACEGRAPAG